MLTTRRAIALSALAGCIVPGTALAEPIDGIYFDRDECDNHGFLVAVEEFGDPAVFAPDEAIAHVSTVTQIPACPPMDNPDMLNALVEITNLTGRFLTDLFYVGDPDTSFSNVDGIGDALPPAIDPRVGLAFRIDSFGLNRPLIFESITPDGVFEPGETWQFIVQDYVNAAGLAPDAFFTIGMADASGGFPGGPDPSSASIVRMVPTPGTAALLGLAGLAAARRRR